MFTFVFQILIMASLAIMIFILAKALPRVAEENWDEAPKDGFDRFINRIPVERVDIAIQQFIIKILRKTKVIVLKFDNALNGYLERLKKNAPKDPSIMKERMERLSGSGNGMPKNDDQDQKSA